MEQMEKDILQILHNVRGGKPLSANMIRRQLPDYPRTHQVESILRDLKTKGLLRPVRRVSGDPNDRYEIDIAGVQCVENNFVIVPKESSHTSASPIIINNGQIVFGSLTNINIFELINELNIDMSQKQEVMNIYSNIQQEVKNEQINKSKLKDLLKKLADKGSTKLAEAAIGAIIKELFS